MTKEEDLRNAILDVVHNVDNASMANHNCAFHNNNIACKQYFELVDEFVSVREKLLEAIERFV